MATSKSKKEREVTLFFASEEMALRAKDALGQTRRRPTSLDKSHGGSYSAMTGHYGDVPSVTGIVRVHIRYKLIVSESAISSLSSEKRYELGIVGMSTNEEWIVT